MENFNFVIIDNGFNAVDCAAMMACCMGGPSMPIY